MSELPVSPEAAPEEDGLADAGVARNTLLQLVSQVASGAFTAGLTLYLVRALGASSFGIYALAVSIGSLMLFPAGLGLPLAIGRFLADYRGNAHQVRSILRVGMKLQITVAAGCGIGLFAAAGAIADAYGDPGLGWPLRWVALSVVGQALFAFLSSAGASLRRVSVSLWMSIIESAAETSTSIVLVLAGAGAAGAALGKTVGYSLATVAGIYLTLALIGRARRGEVAPREVSLRTITRYAGTMFLVDITWSAITQLDVLLIGALLSSAAVGSFSAVLRLLTVLGYLGIAVAAGVAPRLSLAAGNPDTRTFELALRYLTIVQGLAIAPMIVWARPIVDLLLGPGYASAGEIMRVLAPYFFISGPAALITIGVTYLGEARRRVVLMVWTLVFGLLVTYVLLRAVGVVGAAIADGVIEVVYVGGHLWICATLITLDLRRLALCAIRTVLAAGAMALVLLAIGTGHLSVAQWIAGGAGGGAAYVAALLLTRELSIDEIRVVAGQVRGALRGGAPPGTVGGPGDPDRAAHVR